MFNLSGSEIVIILLLALVILGPEKLPDAIRRFGRMYGELKRMSDSFQDEMRATLDEPMREMRETADLLREQASEITDPRPDLRRDDPTSDDAAESDPDAMLDHDMQTRDARPQSDPDAVPDDSASRGDDGKTDSGDGEPEDAPPTDGSGDADPVPDDDEGERAP